MAEITNLISRKLHPITGEDLRPTVATLWQDGSTPMTDSLCGGLYNKDTQVGSPTFNQYFRWNSSGPYPLSRLVNVSEANFKKLVADFGASAQTLHVNKAINITSNFTIPANITLNFENGGSFNISNGITLTINGGIVAGSYQIFTGLGLPSIKSNTPFNISWMGCKGDYNHSTLTGTDNTAMFRKVLQYVVAQGQTSQYAIPRNRAGTVYIPQGTWLFTDEIAVPGGATIIGEGRNSTLLVADMRNGSARPTGYKDLFVTQDLGEPYDNNRFSHFAIQGTNADAWVTDNRRYSLKCGIRLNNGYEELSNLNIVGCEDYGVYADIMIGSTFDRVLVDYCGKAGLWLSGTITPSTTACFTSCTFRGTRRGPGIKLSGKIISTSFHNCLFELNGVENPTGGFGCEITGDTGITGSVPFDLNVGFYGCDWESNQDSKIKANNAHIFLDENCRFTNNITNPDFDFENCAVNFQNTNYRGSSSVVFRFKSSTNTSTRANIYAPNVSINDMSFVDGSNVAQTYEDLRQLKLYCVGADGTFNINYMGRTGTFEGGYLKSKKAGTEVTNELTLSAYGTGSAVTGTDIALLGVTATGKVIPLGAKFIQATASLNFPSTAAGAVSDLTMTVTGAALGNAVSLGVPSGTGDGIYFAWVSAANTVTVRFFNYTASAVDPGNGTFRIAIIKP